MFRQWWCFLAAEKLIQEMLAQVERPIISCVRSYPSSPFCVDGGRQQKSWHGGISALQTRPDFAHLAKRSAFFPRSRPVSRSLAGKNKKA